MKEIQGEIVLLLIKIDTWKGTSEELVIQLKEDLIKLGKLVTNKGFETEVLIDQLLKT